jgi:hypothetical protein
MDSDHIYLLEKYPDRCPIIVDKKKSIKMSKYKFLVPRSFTMGELLYYLRTRVVDLNSSEALFMFIGNNIISNTLNLNNVYENNKINGLLYITLVRENVFG